MIRHAAMILFVAAGAAVAAPEPGTPWDWQLGDKVRFHSGVSVYDFDPGGPTPAQMRKLNAAGAYTICYVSVGTLEDWQDDVSQFPARVVGKTYDDWPDEKFLDISQLNVILPLMKTRFQNCKAKGFTAIEPDNMDVYDNDSGFPLTPRDGLRYVRALAKMAHEMGLEIGQKNVPDLTPKLVGTMDFVIAESCWQDGWCDQVAPYIRAGKPVFDAEYTDRPINWKRACTDAARAKISMILKDRHLGPKRRGCEQ